MRTRREIEKATRQFFRRNLKEARQLRGGALEPKIHIQTRNDSDVCEACQAASQKQYTVDSVPSLPLKHCTSDSGCRCWITTTF